MKPKNGKQFAECPQHGEYQLDADDSPCPSCLDVPAMWDCDVCGEPQEATAEAKAAWDDLIGYECLCQDCYWVLND